MRESPKRQNAPKEGRAIPSTPLRYREVAACAVVCIALCACMWPLLAFAPLSPGRIGVQICAVGVVAAIGALTARCAPPSATAGRHDPRAVRTAVAAIAAGAVLYLACSAALDLALAGAAGWPLFALPAGILVSALGCLLWAFGFARRALSEQVEAHLEKTMDALRYRYADGKNVVTIEKKI